MTAKTSAELVQDPKVAQPAIVLTTTGELDPDTVIRWVGKTSRADGLISFPGPDEMQPPAQVIKGGPLDGLSIQVGSPWSSPTLTATVFTPTGLDSLSADRTVTSLTAGTESTASP